jgi:hypothetical protein
VTRCACSNLRHLLQPFHLKTKKTFGSTQVDARFDAGRLCQGPLFCQLSCSQTSHLGQEGVFSGAHVVSHRHGGQEETRRWEQWFCSPLIHHLVDEVLLVICPCRQWKSGNLQRVFFSMWWEIGVGLGQELLCELLARAWDGSGWLGSGCQAILGARCCRDYHLGMLCQVKSKVCM